MAEWTIAAVLKTVEGNTSGGSNPSFSADKSNEAPLSRGFLFFEKAQSLLSLLCRKIKNSVTFHLIMTQSGRQ